jgi:hypothetical protein
MSLIDKIKESQKTKQIERKQPLPLEQIPYMTLLEFGKRYMALEIDSEILGCHIWLCSNEEMEAQVKKDEPGGLTFTVKELEALLRLNPTPEDIRRVHEAKSVFEGAKVIESKLKGNGTRFLE